MYSPVLYSSTLHLYIRIVSFTHVLLKQTVNSDRQWEWQDGQTQDRVSSTPGQDVITKALSWRIHLDRLHTCRLWTTMTCTSSTTGDTSMRSRASPELSRCSSRLTSTSCGACAWLTSTHNVPPLGVRHRDRSFSFLLCTHIVASHRPTVLRNLLAVNAAPSGDISECKFIGNSRTMKETATEPL